MKKNLLGTLKNAKEAILKIFYFLRDAAHVTRKRCILSKNFIEHKSSRIKKYLLGTLKIAKKAISKKIKF